MSRTRPHLPLACLLAGLLPAQSPPESLVGTWQGEVRASGFSLHLVLRVHELDGATYRATLDVLDERLGGLAVEDLALVDGAVRLAVPAMGARFTGALAAGPPRQIRGHWLPGTGRVPASFASVAAPRLPERPQEPAGEVPYRAHDVTFSAPDRGGTIGIAGTLSVPDGEGPHPAIVLIAGSGYQDRDATIRGHRPFLVLADHLTRQGFAVLRYDKRGCGRSEGDLRAATSRALAGDAAAALRYLRGHGAIDPTRVGLLGHSEGGMLAPMVAAGSDAADVRFVVSLAGPGVSGEEAIVHQVRRMARADGMPLADTDRLAVAHRRFFALLRSESDDERRRAALDAAARAAWSELSGAARDALGGSEDNLVARALRLDTPWMRYFADHDPARDLRGVACPVLVLCGEKDVHVDPARHLPAIRAALAAGPCDDATVRELPGLNHLFQRCATGSPDAYYDLEETMAPAALGAITDWLRQRLAR